MIDRRLGRRRALVAGSHMVGALLLALMALGAPHYAVSVLSGVPVMPPQYDLVLFVLIGLATSAQPLLFGMSRQLVDAQVAGKALAAVNLAFFLGAADAIGDRCGGRVRGAAGGAAVHGGRADGRSARFSGLHDACGLNSQLSSSSRKVARWAGVPRVHRVAGLSEFTIDPRLNPAGSQAP